MLGYLALFCHFIIPWINPPFRMLARHQECHCWVRESQSKPTHLLLWTWGVDPKHISIQAKPKMLSTSKKPWFFNISLTISPKTSLATGKILLVQIGCPIHQPKSTWVNQKSRRLAVPRCPRKHAIPNAVRPHSAVASMVSKDNSFNNVMTWRFLQKRIWAGRKMTCLLHWEIPWLLLCFVGWLVRGEKNESVCQKRVCLHNGIEVKLPTFYVDMKHVLWLLLYAEFLVVFMRKNDLNSNDEVIFLNIFPLLPPSRFSSQPPRTSAPNPPPPAFSWPCAAAECHAVQPHNSWSGFSEKYAQVKLDRFVR